MAISNKREKIVRAALELIAEKGFHGASMAMIANRSATAAGTIYNYFESKDVLIKELHREIGEKIEVYIYQGYSTSRPTRERYIHIGTRLLKYFTTHPLDFKYVEQFYNSPYGVDYRRGKLIDKYNDNELCTNLFYEAINQHVVINVPIIILLNLAFGPLIALARDHILGFVYLDECIIDITVTACWNSVKL